MKQKWAFSPDFLTASEKRLLAGKSRPSRIWMATLKPVYNVITRRSVNWSNGEGTDDRIARDDPTIRDLAARHDAVPEVALCTSALPARGVGGPVFAETELSAEGLRALIPKTSAELVHPVPQLPRLRDGSLRSDVLQLIATNRLDDLEEVLRREPDLEPLLCPIVATRLNLTDRVLRG